MFFGTESALSVTTKLSPSGFASISSHPVGSHGDLLGRLDGSASPTKMRQARHWSIQDNAARVGPSARRRSTLVPMTWVVPSHVFRVWWASTLRTVFGRRIRRLSRQAAASSHGFVATGATDERGDGVPAHVDAQIDTASTVEMDHRACPRPPVSDAVLMTTPRVFYAARQGRLRWTAVHYSTTTTSVLADIANGRPCTFHSCRSSLWSQSIGTRRRARPRTCETAPRPSA